MDTVDYMSEAMKQGKSVLIEGANAGVFFSFLFFKVHIFIAEYMWDAMEQGACVLIEDRGRQRRCKP